MKIYVTKYLFTEGIQEMEAEDHGSSPALMGTAVALGSGTGFLNGKMPLYGNDWHRTREAAVAHAEKLRTKKLDALDKQRRKIEAMTFA